MWHNLVVLIRWLTKKEIFIWQNISKNSNDARCHIVKLPYVNILVCTIVASVVARTHPWVGIKFSYSYYTKNISFVVYD
jgi:hypothetical protein